MRHHQSYARAQIVPVLRASAHRVAAYEANAYIIGYLKKLSAILEAISQYHTSILGGRQTD